MFLLLPMLLLTTSANKLVGLDLGLLGDAGALPPPPPGPVESLMIEVREDALVLRAGLRRTDLGAGLGDVTVQEEILEGMDLVGLQGKLRAIKALDPSRERVSISPADGVDTQAVVRVMDAARGDAQGALFGQVVLSTLETP